MKDDTSDAGAKRIRLVTMRTSFAVVLYVVTLVALAHFVSSLVSGHDIRGALFMRSAYEDAGSEVVRQYRVALKRQNMAQLCVFAGMIAAVYAQAHDERSALDWKVQEGRDCSAAGMKSVWGDVRAQ